jgi:hypothetical protein
MSCDVRYKATSHMTGETVAIIRVKTIDKGLRRPHGAAGNICTQVGVRLALSYRCQGLAVECFKRDAVLLDHPLVMILAWRHRHHGIHPRKAFCGLGVDRPHGAATVPTHRHGVVPPFP